MMAVNWPSDSHGELLEDGSADRQLQELLAGYIRSGFNPLCNEFRRARADQIAEYSSRCEIYEAYGSPPPSLRIEPTAHALGELRIASNSPDARKILRKHESVIYEIGMTEENCRREDPYTGTQFIYDYLYCRNGPGPSDKSRNLILYFPNIRRRVWKAKNPDDPARKSSNWYLTASAHVYRDGWTFFR
jgi:hypothetical protein